MCGRFFLDSSPGEMLEHYDMPAPDIFAARYNIAPTTPVLACTGEALRPLRWGLVPSWAKDLSAAKPMFNARAETIAQKPSFRQAYRRRRCLIPTNGFYEWRAEQGRKQPYCCHINHSLFSFAGIWEHWQDAEGNELESCALITTEAKAAMLDLHQRMPVAIAPQHYADWLDCRSEKTDLADELLRISAPQYQYYAVSTAVNNVRNEGAELKAALNPD